MFAASTILYKMIVCLSESRGGSSFGESIFSYCGQRYCKWIDLSYAFNNETMYWGNSARFHHKLIHEGPVIANNVTLIPHYTAKEISTSEHGGTHMDAPIHFAKGTWSIDQIPAEKLVGDAVVVDISAKSAADRNAQLMTDDLEK